MNKKLHFGCSDKYPGPIKGWDNLDLNPRNDKIVKCDVTKGLPYNDNSISHIFSVHTFEHFTLTETRNVLKDCFKKLKNGGVIRILVPDLVFAINEFNNFDVSIFSKKFKNKYEFLLWFMYDTDSTSTPHKYMFYGENLVSELKNAGFKNIKLVSDDNKKSEYNEFKNIENFIIKSIAVEAKK